MNILIAGRLGRFSERIMALADLGHSLVYCTLPAPLQKPIPDVLPAAVPQYVLVAGQAGSVVPQIIDKHRIDVIYSMKNVWDGSLELVQEMLDAGVWPIVRHYKEHYCRPSVVERRSLTETAGQIYINEESLSYFREIYGVSTDTAHILDTDYLPERYFAGAQAPKMSDGDGEPHLLIAGGVTSTHGRTDVRELCAALSRQRVHVHIYGGKFMGPNEFGVWAVGHEGARRDYERLQARGYVHLHDHIPPEQFVAEWSRYDAGLMHVVARGTHEVEFQRLNRPNRLVPYLAAGLPIAQHAGGHDAMERLVTTEGVGFVYGDYDELAEILRDRARIRRLGEVVRSRRMEYTFERHAGELAEVLQTHARRGSSLPGSAAGIARDSEQLGIEGKND